jgi:hypothetical protein
MLMPPPLLTDEDNRQLRAWRLGQLDENASHAFETRLFLEPDLLRAAQLDQALRDGMDIHAPGIAQAPKRRRTAARALGGLALAAGLAGLAVWPMLPRGTQAVSTGNVEWVSVDVRRGAEEPMLVAPRASTRLLALELPAPAEGDLFDVSLVADQGGEAPIHLSQLSADQGVLSLAFERAALSPGVYYIEVRPHGAAEAQPVSRLAFRYRP